MDKITPLTPAVFHILLALFEQERHGYDIMRQVHEDSNGQVTMGPGTLYGSIDRMAEAGLVTTAPKPSADPRRIYYRLTPKGKAALQTEAKRLAQVTRVAISRKVTAA